MTSYLSSKIEVSEDGFWLELQSEVLSMETRVNLCLIDNLCDTLSSLFPFDYGLG